MPKAEENIYFRLDGHTPVPVPTSTLATWDPKDRRVARTEMANGTVVVSTVFLSINHGYSGRPMLFETLVRGGDNDEYTRRYATWDEAEAGHAAIVKALRAGVSLDTSSYEPCPRCGRPMKNGAAMCIVCRKEKRK